MVADGKAQKAYQVGTQRGRQQSAGTRPRVRRCRRAELRGTEPNEGTGSRVGRRAGSSGRGHRCSAAGAVSAAVAAAGRLATGKWARVAIMDDLRRHQKSGVRTMVMLALMVMGAVSGWLPIDAMPEVNLPFAFTVVQYPGASPQAVEND